MRPAVAGRGVPQAPRAVAVTASRAACNAVLVALVGTAVKAVAPAVAGAVRLAVGGLSSGEATASVVLAERASAV